MLKKSFVFCLFVFALTFGCNKTETLYKVVGVKDGDTVVLLSPDNQSITVRLAEIDCPEKSQAFGQAAKQFTSDLCFGKKVKLIGNQKDRYGRTVAQVELENGTNVNYEIVKQGFAWQYRAYSKSMELAMLEKHAREARLGLWQDTNPTPPWNFRKEAKTKRVEKKATKAKRPYKKRKAHKKRDTIAF
ncbi:MULTISPECIES: thermonuclease family protein [unclassified Mucilaginibacter]|uniref:thermonuclease family protein n=1 Tax=unclassified Mucilaginibacter TaxID=2617802 RepID=UPI002AC8F991|nr:MULTISPECIES: thermonuclease family protein [unclassified Mucilaginibacter]MEB0262198.1 thermonuclease family protein [Mucilaginibacter sp. 10I4]MEB0277058.1 thermonuclease family protein [Mucilaginibacter sp. 10B2]MEB0302194.1 thermonuclease family protein [Mucilaginibacter sp. 5C4]WPX25159.1 thermonuclease family protein [Mucilaginibacter sp. 5C4]